MIPGPWSFALLALAAYRVFKLISDDTILDRPRAWILGRGGGEYRKHGIYWQTFITCPWCAGFWISLAWVGAWWLWPHWTLVAAVPFAVSAALGIVAVSVNAIIED